MSSAGAKQLTLVCASRWSTRCFTQSPSRYSDFYGTLGTSHALKCFEWQAGGKLCTQFGH